MRHVAIQILTWGTVAGAAGSALLLAALGAGPRQAIEPSLADATDIVSQAVAVEGPSAVERRPAADTSQVGER